MQEVKVVRSLRHEDYTVRTVAWLLTLVIALTPTPALAQTSVPDAPATLVGDTPILLPVVSNEYRVGQDDLLQITVFEVPELGTTARVTASGYVSLSLIGPVKASGLTPNELGMHIESLLRERYVNNPHVNVFVSEYGSQPVSMIGAVSRPGIYQIKGEKSLLSMLALAGGLTGSAGKTIQIIRGSGTIETDAPSRGGLNAPPNLNLPAEAIAVNVEDLTENGRTELNVPIYSGDIINVLQAGSIFVVGETKGPGEYVLRNGRNVMVTQAVALGGGFTENAKRSATLIIRLHRDGSREEISVDPDKIMKGEMPDVALLPNDILWVPPSKAKPALRRTLDTAIGIATSVLMFGMIGRTN